MVNLYSTTVARASNQRWESLDNAWTSVTFGAGIFVAVSSDGDSNRVMTSSDGITWYTRKTPENNAWQSVTYGGGLFVAVASSGTNRVMYSSDGITWTSASVAAANAWQSVTYGGGVYVAVSNTGTGNRVMSSTDGITWTSRTSASDNNWQAVTYGGGVFAAVSTTGTGDRVMTSSDGITWTSRTSAADNSWQGITYGGGLFVAVSNSGTGNRVMTSPDGTTWTSRTSAANNSWSDITYDGTTYVAVATTGLGNRVATSTDGITWTSQTSSANNTWNGIAYGNSIFAAVASTGTRNRCMTSPTGTTWTIRNTTGNPSNLRITGAMTIELWIKPVTAIGATNLWGLVTKDDVNAQRSYYLDYYNNGTSKLIRFGYFSNGSTLFQEHSFTYDLGNTAWTHIAIVCDPSLTANDRVKLLINGISQGYGSRTGSETTIFDGTSNFVIGGYNFAGVYADAKLDEVRVWNVARSDAQILANYDKEISGSTSNLVGYWQFENNGRDTSNSAVTLTGTNAPTFTSDVPFVGATQNSNFFINNF